MNLPSSFAKILPKFSATRDQIGMSPAEVYKITADQHTYYLKVSHKRLKGTTYDVEREMNVLLWLENKLNVPRVVHFDADENNDYLLMSEVEGKGLIAGKNHSPAGIVHSFAESIRAMQSLDISNCSLYSNSENRITELKYLLNNKLAAVDDFYEDNLPFETPELLVEYLESNLPKDDLVFSHGDLCAQNILVCENGMKGYIDWGRGGKADKWVDIAFCVRSIRDHIGDGTYVDMFFEILGILPDWEKINYFILLDVLF